MIGEPKKEDFFPDKEKADAYIEEEVKIECLNPDDDYMWYSPTMECHKCHIGIVGTKETVKKCPRCGNKKLVEGKGRHD